MQLRNIVAPGRPALRGIRTSAAGPSLKPHRSKEQKKEACAQSDRVIAILQQGLITKADLVLEASRLDQYCLTHSLSQASKDAIQSPERRKIVACLAEDYVSALALWRETATARFSK